MWAILSIRVENKPGILFKVTHLFRARNFNIDSISVGVMENPEFSKMVITTVGTEKQIAQIVKQLDKMIDTIEVKRLDEKESVYKELALFKVKLSDASDSAEINKLANTFGAKIHNEQENSLIVELTSTPDEIKSFEESIKSFDILDSARTGVTAL
ncbi:acetolactate synthase small subunit [Marine Group I thaumarchaeote]|jgi:acetolactate synthase-1/3 small subunit|uniref:Acetolactate synthase small subunit n=1 Tax=Marine Group I thaumarchaeote TaxID=2511932 RepID=A0A7K4NRA3_9ARCH|nr:acetolactate synthase small subunit [Marine Group I thaumarchaeote]